MSDDRISNWGDNNEPLYCDIVLTDASERWLARLAVMDGRGGGYYHKVERKGLVVIWLY